MKRAALAPALALVALFAVPGSPAATGRPLQDAGDVTGLTITDAATPDYPSDPFAITVCLDGSPFIMEAGDQVSDTGNPGARVIDVFSNNDGQCSGTPDQTLTVTLAEGDMAGVVVGWDTLFSYEFDASCMEAGTGRIQLANGADWATPADYYAISEENGDAVLLAADVLPGTSVLVPNVPAGPYVIRAYTPGTPDPETTAPIAQFGAFTLQDGYQSQVFLTGSNTGDNLFGSFQIEQGPLVCSEPPEEEPTSTTATTSTTAPVAPGTATPATPVSGTAAYTG